MSTAGAVTQDESRTKLALALAAAAVITMVILAMLDHEGAGWMLQPVLGAAAVAVAWRAGGTSPQRNLRAFVALVIGSVMVLIFLGFVISGE